MMEGGLIYGLRASRMLTYERFQIQGSEKYQVSEYRFELGEVITTYVM